MAGMQFRAMAEAGVKQWRRPHRLDFLDRLPTAPIADSEILHLAHYGPIVVVPGPDGPRVALLLDPALSRSDPIGKDGRWRLPYCPMALRCLPFWPGRALTDIEIAIDLATDQPDPGLSIYDATGQPSKAFTAVVTLIERLQLGMRRLSEAAKMLQAADVLAPLVIDRSPTEPHSDTGYLTVSPGHLAALTPSRAAALSMDRCLPLELATACLFSARLLAPRVKPLRTDTGHAGPARAAVPDTDPGLTFEAHMRIDSSPLFSFEMFERIDARAHVAA